MSHYLQCLACEKKTATTSTMRYTGPVTRLPTSNTPDLTFYLTSFLAPYCRHTASYYFLHTLVVSPPSEGLCTCCSLYLRCTPPCNFYMTQCLQVFCSAVTFKARPIPVTLFEDENPQPQCSPSPSLLNVSLLYLLSSNI